MFSLAIGLYFHTFSPHQAQWSADFWTNRLYNLSVFRIYSNAYCHKIFLEYPSPIQVSPFLFQHYQQIVNTDFLKAEMQKILSLSEHETSELQNSNTKSLDSLAFFPINSLPRDIQNVFYKSEIFDTDTFKFVLFAFGSNMSSNLLLSFLFIKYRKNPDKIPKRILQTHHSFHPKEKPLMVSIRISPFELLPCPLKPLWHINILQPLPLFSQFQESSAITKAIEEIFEINANANKDINNMDLSDFTQDTSPTPASPSLSKKTPSPVTSTIFTTLPEVHSFTSHSSKHLQKKNLKLQNPPIEQPQAHNPLEPNHPLLYWNGKVPFQRTKSAN